jgi:hypothetical protein
LDLVQSVGPTVILCNEERVKLEEGKCLEVGENRNKLISFKKLDTHSRIVVEL